MEGEREKERGREGRRIMVGFSVGGCGGFRDCVQALKNATFFLLPPSLFSFRFSFCGTFRVVVVGAEGEETGSANKAWGKRLLTRAFLPCSIQIL